GGYHDGGYTDEIVRINPARGSATILAEKLPAPRALAYADLTGGIVTLLGGITSRGANAPVLRFDVEPERFVPSALSLPGPHPGGRFPGCARLPRFHRHLHHGRRRLDDGSPSSAVRPRKRSDPTLVQSQLFRRAHRDGHGARRQRGVPRGRVPERHLRPDRAL